MSYFEAKMHQIRFRLGFCPRRCWGCLQYSPDPLAGFKGEGLLTSNGKERESGKGGGGKEMGKGEEVDGRGSI